MRVAAIAAAVVLAVVGFLVANPGPVADLDSRLCDLLTGWAGPGTESMQVVIVEIDERSLASLGRWPWPRDLMGRLAQQILTDGAAAVVLDMMFAQEDGGRDEALAEALGAKPDVIGYTMKFDSAGPPVGPCPVQPMPLVLIGAARDQRRAFFHATDFICSVPAISQAAAGNGFLNAAPDHDGTMRHVPVIVESGGRYYPSLALAALNLYRHVSSVQLAIDAHGARFLRLDNHIVPLEGPAMLRLRFRGAARKFPYASAADVLSAGVPQELLRGKIALVGGTALGIQNPFVTPVNPLFPDAEIQATAIDNLIEGDSFSRPGNARFWELLFAVLAGAVSTWLLMRLPSLWGTLAVVGLGALAWAGCALLLASTRMLFSPLPVTAVLACILPVLTLLNYLQEKNRADRAQRELTAMMQRSLEVLRESESRYQRLVDNVNDAIVVDDVEGRLVFANRRFREWFGLNDAQIEKTALEQYVAPEWRAEVRDRHLRRMQGETVPDHFEFEGIRPDGTRIWLEALVTKVEENGRVVGTQAALRDTTERKKIEAQYLQARKMDTVGRLAGGVAHDFNNLLTVIISYSDVLLDRLAPGDPLRNGLEQIRKAGDRASELTRKLLAFSRKQLVHPRPVDLNQIVMESGKMLERVIGEDIQLITLLSPDLGHVIADPGQIHQALMNLLVNARDAMPHGGKVIVETRNVSADRTPNGSVYLGVTDFGTGMSDEVKQHLYEPFFTTKEPGKGTGLGLATVYGIVHQVGGRIEVASELGKGTAVHIYLPRVEPASPEPPAPQPAEVNLRGKETILVVEDQDAVRQLAIMVLQSYGYGVLHASNGPDAIRLAEAYQDVIHLLVTDIIMPYMDGRVLADKLRSVRPEMKVLYVSGYSEERIGRSRSLDAGLPYLAKPFTPEVLATRVRQILGVAGMERRMGSAE